MTERERAIAFAELCRFLAAHEAAEEEYIHAATEQELEGDNRELRKKAAEGAGEISTIYLWLHLVRLLTGDSTRDENRFAGPLQDVSRT
jgi:hypothetical protein